MAKWPADERNLVLQDCWRHGESLRAFLDTSGPTGGQLAWVRALDQLPPSSWATWEISRQRGKTWAALLWAVNRMCAKPTSVVYLAQTGGNAHAIVSSFFSDVELTLPPEWGVTFDATHGQIACGNGSTLAFFGTDNQQFKRRRGRKADIVLLDEAAFYSDLLDVEQVYVPQLQTTGGVGLYLSSPPISPAHPFALRAKQAKAAGRFIHDTFWSNPRIDHEAVIRGECARLNLTRAQLLASTAFRREFLAEEVTEESRAAIPAWNQQLHVELVGDWARPDFFDAYQAFDPGKIGDPHAWLAGYYDFGRGLVTIEDEFELRSAAHSVKACAGAIKDRERELYGSKAWEGTLLGVDWWAQALTEVPEYLRASIGKQAPRQPFLRVGDNDHLILNELVTENGIAMVPVAKAEKHLAVDFVVNLFREKRVRIHSRCRRLIEQLYTTVWNQARTQWERTDSDHGDLVDCLIYLCRSIAWHRDPRPKPSFGLMSPMTDSKPSWESAFVTRKRR